MASKKTQESKPSYVMTDHQKLLFDKLKPLQKEIALNSISGMNDIDSYRASKGKARTESAQRASASEILTNPNVLAFLDSMTEAKVSDAIMSRDEMAERLSNLSRVDMNDLIEWQQIETEDDEDDEDDGEPITQSMWRIKDSAMQDPLKMAAISELAATKDGIKIKQHSPLASMNQLADLMGYKAATKFDHSSKDGSMSPKGRDLSDFYDDVDKSKP